MAPDGRGTGSGKLAAGVRLTLFASEWDRPCALCELYDFDDVGRLKRLGTGDPMRRGKAPTPCGKCAKVPHWAKAAGKSWLELRALASEITDANREAYKAYMRFKAVGRFPDDELVEWYSGIIRAIEDEKATVPAEKGAAATLALIQAFTLLLRRRS